MASSLYRALLPLLSNRFPMHCSMHLQKRRADALHMQNGGEKDELPDPRVSFSRFFSPNPVLYIDMVL